jgi:subtilisin family serine protease
LSRLSISLLALILIGAVSAPSVAAGAPSAGRYIVVLKNNGEDPGAVASEHARRFDAQVSQVYRSALRGYAATIPSNRVAALRKDGGVAFLSLDRDVHAMAQSLPTGVDRIEGDTSSARSGDGTGSVNTPVAIIDTGSGPHADLNVVGGKNCSTGKSYGDGNGHGTHVAGTVAARDNGVGVAGVAPGAPLYSVRVLNNSGSGSWSSVICGIDWVTSNAASRGIKVANMSLGGVGSDDGNCGSSNNDALHRAICGSVAKGVTYVVAAGNDGTDFASSVPAAYEEVLTVTAMADFNGQPGGGAGATCRSDVDDSAADFSNFTVSGSPDEAHTIAAPGVCILSTWKGGGYNTISGTSMATPHVTGTTALCIGIGACAGLSPSALITKLRADAAAQSPSYGFGGDPSTPDGSRYYGYQAYAGGY